MATGGTVAKRKAKAKRRGPARPKRGGPRLPARDARLLAKVRRRRAAGRAAAAAVREEFQAFVPLEVDAAAALGTPARLRLRVWTDLRARARRDARGNWRKLVRSKADPRRLVLARKVLRPSELAQLAKVAKLRAHWAEARTLKVEYGLSWSEARRLTTLGRSPDPLVRVELAKVRIFQASPGKARPSGAEKRRRRRGVA